MGAFPFSTGGALTFDSAAPDGSTGAPVITPSAASGAQGAGARSARSIECSQKADVQNLHGKPRKQLMRDCKHGV